MGHKSNNPNVIVKSIENGVWEWANDDLVKIEMRLPINSAVLLNFGQVTVKCRNKAISESGIPVLVIPSCGLRDVLQHCGENAYVSHARSAFNSFLNWSTVSVEDGFWRNASHLPSNISFSS